MTSYTRPAVQLTVLGSNGTYPTPDRPASGFLVASAHTALVLDMGPGVFPALLDTGRFPDAVVLTHGHADHCLDVLPFYAYLRFDALDRWGVPLLAPQGVTARLAGFSGAGPDDDFFKALRPREVAPGLEIEIGDLKVRFGVVAHPVPAVAVRVEARGRAIVYTGDTGPCDDLVGFASDAALLICEATYQGAPTSDRYPHHLYASEAGALASAAGAHALLLTHVAPQLDPAVSVAEAAAVFPGPVRHAEPGLEVGL